MWRAWPIWPAMRAWYAWALEAADFTPVYLAPAPLSLNVPRPVRVLPATPPSARAPRSDCRGGLMAGQQAWHRGAAAGGWRVSVGIDLGGGSGGMGQRLETGGRVEQERGGGQL
eukprot:9406596-Pyramimonas_sp.AAC.1